MVYLEYDIYQAKLYAYLHLQHYLLNFQRTIKIKRILVLIFYKISLKYFII